MRNKNKSEIETENTITVSDSIPKRRLNDPRILSLLLALAVIGFLAAMAAMLQNKTQLRNVQKELTEAKQELDTHKANPSGKTTEENQALIDKVGQLIILPADEQPTIATVTDLSKLAGQPFFANAKLEDKVLIYANAKKAILYRPSENKIIEIAPLDLNPNTQGTKQKTK